MNVSYPTPLWGLQLSGVFQSYQGQPAQTNWLISRTTRYAADCLGPCTPGALVIPGLVESSVTLPLTPPGTEFLPRHNQLDLRLGKRFEVRRLRISTQLDVFNVLNANTVEDVRNFNYGVAGYLLPSQVLQARLTKISATFNF
jgi:hypothetical protein